MKFSTLALLLLAGYHLPAVAILGQEELNQLLLQMVRQDRLTDMADTIQAGAEINAQDEHGQTPLLIATTKAYKAGLVWLLKRGALTNVEDHVGATALSTALWWWASLLKTPDNTVKDRADIVKILMDNGANTTSLSPLHHAVQWQSKEVMEFLIARANSKEEALNSTRHPHSRTPLMVAVCRNYIDGAQFLLKHGANPNTPDDSKMSPLRKALDSGLADMAGILVANNASTEGMTLDAALLLCPVTKRIQMNEVLNRHADRFATSAASSKQ